MVARGEAMVVDQWEVAVKGEAVAVAGMLAVGQVL